MKKITPITLSVAAVLTSNLLQAATMTCAVYGEDEKGNYSQNIVVDTFEFKDGQNYVLLSDNGVNYQVQVTGTTTTLAAIRPGAKLPIAAANTRHILFGELGRTISCLPPKN